MDAVDEFEAACARYRAALRDALRREVHLTEPEAITVTKALEPFFRDDGPPGAFADVVRVYVQSESRQAWTAGRVWRRTRSLRRSRG